MIAYALDEALAAVEDIADAREREKVKPPEGTVFASDDDFEDEADLVPPPAPEWLRAA